MQQRPGQGRGGPRPPAPVVTARAHRPTTPPVRTPGPRVPAPVLRHRCRERRRAAGDDSEANCRRAPVPVRRAGRQSTRVAGQRPPGPGVRRVPRRQHPPEPQHIGAAPPRNTADIVPADADVLIRDAAPERRSAFEPRPAPERRSAPQRRQFHPDFAIAGPAPVAALHGTRHHDASPPSNVAAGSGSGSGRPSARVSGSWAGSPNSSSRYISRRIRTLKRPGSEEIRAAIRRYAPGS
jgi:hypothetical protein